MGEGGSLGALIGGMRILITGGFGFIGGRLGQYLSRTGHTVVLGSRRELGFPEWLPDSEVVQTLWSDEQALRKICEGTDVVIHAAGMNAGECMENPVAALEFNGLATARLTSAANAVGVERFLYLSTAHVYASPLVGFITENNCPGNQHPYATSHLAGEAAVLWAARTGAMKSLVLRVSNGYGVPADPLVNCWTLLVNDLCRQIAETGRMVLRGSGSDVRDFIPMGAVCRAIGALLDCNADLWHDIFNLGSGGAVSVLAMAHAVQDACVQLTGFTPEIVVGHGGGSGEVSLAYTSNRLDEMGIDVVSDAAVELRALLRYCFKVYGRDDI